MTTETTSRQPAPAPQDDGGGVKVSVPLLKMLFPTYYRRKLEEAIGEQHYMATAGAIGVSEAEAREILGELRADNGPQETVDWAAARAQLIERSATPVNESAPVPADPRIGQLMDLAQGLLAGYADLATGLAMHIPDPGLRRRLTAEAEKTLEVARGRYSAIATTAPSPAPQV